MLTREENELLTRVGPGTPMGNLIREYWIPALPSNEFPGPDSPAKRMRLLGENLVMFRDSDGKRRVFPGVLPPPWRESLLRPLRRGRSALHLPRLEV